MFEGAQAHVHEPGPSLFQALMRTCCPTSRSVLLVWHGLACTRVSAAASVLSSRVSPEYH